MGFGITFSLAAVGRRRPRSAVKVHTGWDFYRGVIFMNAENDERDFPVVCGGGSAGGLDADVRV